MFWETELLLFIRLSVFIVFISFATLIQIQSNINLTTYFQAAHLISNFISKYKQRNRLHNKSRR